MTFTSDFEACEALYKVKRHLADIINNSDRPQLNDRYLPLPEKHYWHFVE